MLEDTCAAIYKSKEWNLKERIHCKQLHKNYIWHVLNVNNCYRNNNFAQTENESQPNKTVKSLQWAHHSRVPWLAEKPRKELLLLCLEVEQLREFGHLEGMHQGASIRRSCPHHFHTGPDFCNTQRFHERSSLLILTRILRDREIDREIL